MPPSERCNTPKPFQLVRAAGTRVRTPGSELAEGVVAPGPHGAVMAKGVDGKGACVESDDLAQRAHLDGHLSGLVSCAELVLGVIAPGPYAPVPQQGVARVHASGDGDRTTEVTHFNRLDGLVPLAGNPDLTLEVVAPGPHLTITEQCVT